MLPVALAVLGTALILLREITFGVGMDADSTAYIAAARNLVAGNGLIVYEGRPLTLWPPLFPMLLAVACLFGFDPADFAGLLNAGAFGASVFVSGWWLRTRLESRLPALWGTLAVLLSVTLTHWAAMAMSEPVFILFTLLSLIQTEKFLNNGKGSSLTWAAMFTTLACLTRYIGVTIVVTVVMLLLLKRDTILEQFKRIAAYFMVSLTPLGVWMLRNLMATGTLAGYRQNTPNHPFLEHLERTPQVLAGWIHPSLTPKNMPVFTAVVGGICLLALAIAVTYGLISSLRKMDTRPSRSPIYTFGTFALIYIIIIAVAASQGNTPLVNHRFLAPIYVPLVLVVAFVVDRWLEYGYRAETPGRFGSRRIRGRLKSLLTLAPVSGLFLWLAYPVAHNIHSIDKAINQGTSIYTNERWADSDLMQYIEQHLAGIPRGRVYSNEIYATYIHAEVHASPLPLDEDALEQVRWNAVAAGDTYIIWFEKPLPAYSSCNYGRPELERHLDFLRLEPIREGSDGVIYRVSTEGFMDKAAEAIEEAGSPVIRSTYDVYISENRLIYLKDPCVQADTEATFFLHLNPVSGADLPDWRKQHGFDNLDFNLDWHGYLRDRRCVGVRVLPDYDIAAGRTGQYIPGKGELWEGAFRFDE